MNMPWSRERESLINLRVEKYVFFFSFFFSLTHRPNWGQRNNLEPAKIVDIYLNTGRPNVFVSQRFAQMNDVA